MSIPNSSSSSSSFSKSAPRVVAAVKDDKRNWKSAVVLSYNVNFGSCYDEETEIGSNYSTERVLKAIAESKADIVCLQETHKGWEKACRKVFSKDYPTQVWKHPDGGYLAAGSAIMLKSEHKLSKLEMLQPKVEGSFFPGMYAVVSLNGDDKSPLSVVNVHLRPPLPMGNGSLWSFATIKAYFWQTGTVREGELSTFVKHWERPHLVLGDCNEGSNGKGYAYMTKNGYSDAVNKANTTTTWYWPLFWKVELSGSYDHIFYDARAARVDLSECRVLTAYKHASDHLPVVATVRW